MVPLRDIKAAARRIAELFHPQRIILFGSHARGDANKHSDVDLLVLMKGRGRKVHEKALDIRMAIDFGFPPDLLTRSPEEFRRRIGWGDGFLKEIDEKGITLYEAVNTRVDQESRRRLRNGATRVARTKVA
jgi:predicted nucleotidyltransferase